MRNHQIVARRCRPLQHIQRRHHRHRHARHRSVRITRLERIHRLRAPRHAHFFLDAFNDLLRGDGRRLRASARRPKQTT